MTSIDDRNSRTRAIYSTRTGYSNLPQQARAADYFTDLADSSIAAQVAHHAEMVAKERAAAQALRAHQGAERAAVDADALALAAALREGKEPPADANTEAWRIERDRLARIASGYQDALAGAFVDLVGAVRENREELADAYEDAAASKRAELDALLAQAANLIRDIDEATRAVKVINHVADQGPNMKGIKFSSVHSVFTHNNRPMTAADVLGLVANYRAPSPRVEPEPLIFDEGPSRRTRSGREAGVIRGGVA